MDGGKAGNAGTEGSMRIRVVLTSGVGATRRVARRAPLSVAGACCLGILALGTRSVPAGPPPGLGRSVLYDPSTLGADPPLPPPLARLGP